MLLRQLPYAIKNHKELLGGFGTQNTPRMVLYGIRDRWLPWTEKSYYRRPYAIKNQRGSRMIMISVLILDHECSILIGFEAMSHLDIV